MRRLLVLCVFLIVVSGAGASAAAGPNLSGSWRGSYTIRFQRISCYGAGCMPGSTGYCATGDSACTPGNGQCPGFQIAGEASATLTQAGAALKGTITLTGGLMHLGLACTIAARDDYRFHLTGAVSKNSALTRSAWGDGPLYLVGGRLSGRFASDNASSASVLTVSFHAR